MLRTLIFSITAGFISTWSIAAAQPSPKVSKVGWLSAAPEATSSLGQNQIIGFLQSFGYVKGKNIEYEFRNADNRVERLPTLADELVKRKMDVLITPGTTSALALRNATKTIPIIFTDVTDPIGAGLVESLAKPGGNVTGFTSIESVLTGKRLELLNEAIRELSRVGVLWDPENRAAQQEWRESQEAARQLALSLFSLEVSRTDQYGGAFDRAAKARCGALVVLSNALAFANRQQIVELAAKHRLPSIYFRKEFVALGGLMSYGPDQSERYRRVAALIDKVLKGAKPADLPVEQPKKFELVINLKTAKQIGLTIPPNVLARADRVIR
jgi:putative tryptophan/tyrosine transport system substrate-binding protein